MHTKLLSTFVNIRNGRSRFMNVVLVRYDIRLFTTPPINKLRSWLSHLKNNTRGEKKVKLKTVDRHKFNIN